MLEFFFYKLTSWMINWICEVCIEMVCFACNNSLAVLFRMSSVCLTISSSCDFSACKVLKTILEAGRSGHDNRSVTYTNFTTLCNHAFDFTIASKNLFFEIPKQCLSIAATVLLLQRQCFLQCCYFHLNRSKVDWTSENKSTLPFYHQKQEL